MNGFGITCRLAGAAIRTVIVDVEVSVIFLFDGLDWARSHAVADLLALFLIDLVHIASLENFYKFSFPANPGRAVANAVNRLALDEPLHSCPVFYREI